MVDGVVATTFGTAAGLPVTDAVKVKHAAGAKMQLVYRATPRLLRLLHSWRLLTPLHDVISLIGRTVIQTSAKLFEHPYNSTFAHRVVRASHCVISV